MTTTTPSGISHRFIDTNGLRMHIAEQGTGPLVVMCHGFPESWYSWRHQFPALATAGYRAVAPDIRGYGQTDAPQAIDSYTTHHYVGDLVGLLDALGAEKAVVAGHDTGCAAAWHAALLRPDRFRAVVALSVPYAPRGAARPTTVMPQTDESIWYQLYFQTPGVAERELEKNVRESIRRIVYSFSGDAPPGPVTIADPATVGMLPRTGGFLTRSIDPPVLPQWFSEDDLDFYASEFSRTGFRGGLNYYRNADRNWELLAPYADARVQVPAHYLTGDRDLVLYFRGGREERLAVLRRFVLKLRAVIILPGCGHWTQQERPQEVNAAMVRFLRELDS
jgi:pimeloyl-ACP methyl ester carboxylesterase